MPISQRSGVAKLTVTSRSTVKVVPPTQEAGLPGATAMPVIETSFAVQPRSDPLRDAAHSVVPKAWAVAAENRRNSAAVTNSPGNVRTEAPRTVQARSAAPTTFSESPLRNVVLSIMCFGSGPELLYGR